MILQKNKLIDLTELGDKLTLWFFENDWNIKTNKTKEYYIIDAEKTGIIRDTFCANRTLKVKCSHEGTFTKVEIKLGSLRKAAEANLGWLIITGGTWGAFTLWSLKVKNDYKKYAESVLSQY